MNFETKNMKSNVKNTNCYMNLPKSHVHSSTSEFNRSIMNRSVFATSLKTWFVTGIASFFFVLFAGLDANAQNVCATVHSRNNGNNVGVCAGSGQPYATSVSGTAYQTVPSGSKTGNITFKWATGTQPALEPVITNIWINGVSSVCTAGAPTP